MMRRSRVIGFTLLEMVVVLVVIGALTAATLPRYRPIRDKSEIAVLHADLRALRLAEEAYAAEHGRYTLDVDSLAFRTSPDVTVTLSSTNLRTSWRAIGIHAYALASCYTGAGNDAPDGVADAIVCGPGAGGQVSP